MRHNTVQWWCGVKRGGGNIAAYRVYADCCFLALSLSKNTVSHHPLSHEILLIFACKDKKKNIYKINDKPNIRHTGADFSMFSWYKGHNHGL